MAVTAEDGDQSAVVSEECRRLPKPARPRRETSSTNILIFYLSPPKLWEAIFLSFGATQFAIFCYVSSRNVTVEISFFHQLSLCRVLPWMDITDPREMFVGEKITTVSDCWLLKSRITSSFSWNPNCSHFGKNLAIIPVVSLKEWVDRGPCFYFSFLNAVEPFLLNALGLQSKSTVNSFQRPQDWKRSQPVRKETNRLHTSSSRRVFSFFAGSKYERPWDLCLEEVSGTWPYTDLPGGEAPTFCELCRFTDDLINVCQIHGDCWNHPSSPMAAFDI